MKVLVTGGAGFIGSHIVEQLLEEKHQVVIIDDLSTGLLTNIQPQAEFIKMDICSQELNDVLETEKFDYVIHLAAQTMVPKSMDRPDFDCHVNILGTVNLLEACRKNQVKRIIFASSAAVYGDDNQPPIKENAITNPASFYGLSKLTVEKYLELYYKLFGLEYIVLRYANVYGERQGDTGEGGVISIFTRKLQKDEVVQVHGDGGQTRDFIYVGDIAKANLQSLLTTNANRVYNISTKTETSINTLLELLSKVSGRTTEKLYTSPREGDIYRSSLDNNAACQLLNWQPKTRLVDGLARTYNSLITD
ncbi:UDP-glucose 4-epimerase [bioreactor metagenome]|uniref:UDP-glucose 4-epimerase n=1 Tax=bioreactor metagenome TaxID=1076179 RepID=A0A644T0L1_9ZZZZ